MVKILKKISAIAMAFTLLGSSTAVTKIISPQTKTSITAHAECMHDAGVTEYGDLQYCGKAWVNKTYYFRGEPFPAQIYCDVYAIPITVKCSKCGMVYSSTIKYIYVYSDGIV